jgi:hypothetical protein
VVVEHGVVCYSPDLPGADLLQPEPGKVAAEEEGTRMQLTSRGSRKRSRRRARAQLVRAYGSPDLYSEQAAANSGRTCSGVGIWGRKGE